MKTRVSKKIFVPAEEGSGVLAEFSPSDDGLMIQVTIGSSTVRVSMTQAKKLSEWIQKIEEFIR